MNINMLFISLINLVFIALIHGFLIVAFILDEFDTLKKNGSEATFTIDRDTCHSIVQYEGGMLIPIYYKNILYNSLKENVSNSKCCLLQN